MSQNTTAFAQGEVYGRIVSALPEGVELRPFTERNADGAYIVSHSESGHHHLLTSEGVTVLEHPEPPEGMRILYAILENPGKLEQSAANPHGAHDLPAGHTVEFRMAREIGLTDGISRAVID